MAGRAAATSRVPGRKSVIGRAEPSSRTSSRMSGGASSGSGSHWRMRARRRASRPRVATVEQRHHVRSLRGDLAEQDCELLVGDRPDQDAVRVAPPRIDAARGSGSDRSARGLRRPWGPVPRSRVRCTRRAPRRRPRPARGAMRMASTIAWRVASRSSRVTNRSRSPSRPSRKAVRSRHVVAAASQPGHRRRVGVDPDEERVHSTVRRHGTQPPPFVLGLALGSILTWQGRPVRQGSGRPGPEGRVTRDGCLRVRRLLGRVLASCRWGLCRRGSGPGRRDVAGLRSSCRSRTNSSRPRCARWATPGRRRSATSARSRPSAGSRPSSSAASSPTRCWSGPTGDLYNEARSAAVAKGRGVRLWLSLGKAPGLLSVPWEFLYLQPTFLASQRKTPIVRFLSTRCPGRASPDRGYGADPRRGRQPRRAAEARGRAGAQARRRCARARRASTAR